MKRTCIALALCTAITFISFAAPSYAGESKLVWNLTDKHVDEDAVTKIDKTFKTLAQKLPVGFQLEVEVSLLQTAVEPNNQTQFRKSTTADPDATLQNPTPTREVNARWPRMNFQYVLRNNTGAIVKQGQAELKDMDYLNQARARYGEYEANMVKDWFKHEFDTKTLSLAAK